MKTNAWCEILGIQPPRLESVREHRDASTYSMFLIALLERGAAMTLIEVAERFEQAGLGTHADALLALKRCRPGRPPAYREGDLYHLDPRDDELDLWAFRLGLRPPKVARVVASPPSAAVALPGPEVPLTQQELDEAWKGLSLSSWSAQRLAVAVLDCHASPLSPEEVVHEVGVRTRWHLLTASSAKFKRRGSAIAVLDDGRWAVARDAVETVAQVRCAVRERVALARRHASYRVDPAVIEANRVEHERQRAVHAAALAKLSCALLVGFPARGPRFVVLLDARERWIETYEAERFDALRSALSQYDILGAMEVRGLLRGLGFDPRDRRLAELGPAQKSKQLNKRGRTLKITTELLIQGSCGISHPLGESKKLDAYVAAGATGKLLRRLEADAKSLYALFEYGRLHGCVRLRWGFLDERLPAPWVHRDERVLYDLKLQAAAEGAPLEVVVGSAPGWEDPWSRAQIAYVVREQHDTFLVDHSGFYIDDADVQRARLANAREAGLVVLE